MQGWSDRSTVLKLNHKYFCGKIALKSEQVWSNHNVYLLGPQWRLCLCLAICSGGRLFKLWQWLYRVDNYGKLWMTEINAATVFFFRFCGCSASIIVSFYSFLSYLRLINFNKWLKMLYSTLIAFLSFLLLSFANYHS